MFVVSGHLYRPLPLSQPCGLKVKIKDGLGLEPWSLKAKNNAFRSSWIFKLNLGKLNPYLESTLLMAAAFYAEKANTDVPLWESRVDHSSTIRRVTGSELLAEL